MKVSVLRLWGSKAKCVVMPVAVIFALFATSCIEALANPAGNDNADDIISSESAVSVSEGWVRASLPGADNTVAFLTLRNNAALDKTLVAVSCSVARQCELHQHTHVAGKMRMEKVDSLLLPAHSDLKLASGGYHIMLMGVASPLIVGSMVELVFIFEDKSQYSVNIPVKSVRDE